MVHDFTVHTGLGHAWCSKIQEKMCKFGSLKTKSLFFRFWAAGTILLTNNCNCTIFPFLDQCVGGYSMWIFQAKNFAITKLWKYKHLPNYFSWQRALLSFKEWIRKATRWRKKIELNLLFPPTCICVLYWNFNLKKFDFFCII